MLIDWVPTSWMQRSTLGSDDLNESQFEIRVGSRNQTIFSENSERSGRRNKHVDMPPKSCEIDRKGCKGMFDSPVYNILNQGQDQIMEESEEKKKNRERKKAQFNNFVGQMTKRK